MGLGTSWDFNKSHTAAAPATENFGLSTPGGRDWAFPNLCETSQMQKQQVRAPHGIPNAGMWILIGCLNWGLLKFLKPIP